MINSGKNDVEPPKKFPKLMSHTGSDGRCRIILATRKDRTELRGTLVYDSFNDGTEIGTHSSCWGLNFQDYNGCVTLCNE